MFWVRRNDGRSEKVWSGLSLRCPASKTALIQDRLPQNFKFHHVSFSSLFQYDPKIFIFSLSLSLSLSLSPSLSYTHKHTYTFFPFVVFWEKNLTLTNSPPPKTDSSSSSWNQYMLCMCCFRTNTSKWRKGHDTKRTTYRSRCAATQSPPPALVTAVWLKG